MSKVALDDSTIRECSRMINTLSKVFNSAKKQILENTRKDVKITSSFEIDYALNPHEYYYFRWADCYTYILKTRSVFTLVCEGFRPRSLELFQPDSLIELFKNSYGRFNTFDEARNAFSDVVTELITFNPLELTQIF